MKTLAAIGGAVLALCVIHYIDGELRAARATPIRLDPADFDAGLESDCGCGEQTRQQLAIRDVLWRVARLEASFDAHLDALAEQARAELRPDDAEDPP